MMIYIGERHRLRRYDKRNWTLEEFRPPDQSSRTAKSQEAKWRSCDRYFQTIASGLQWVYEHAALDDGFEGELRDAIDRAQGIADSLALRAEALEVAE